MNEPNVPTRIPNFNAKSCIATAFETIKNINIVSANDIPAINIIKCPIYRYLFFKKTSLKDIKEKFQFIQV